MKGLETLIRLGRLGRDDCRMRLAALERQQAELVASRRAKEMLLDSETGAAAALDQRSDFALYAQATLGELNRLKQAERALAVRLETAREELNEAHRAVRSLELVAEGLVERAAAAAAAAEQKALDELALLRHRPR